MFVNIVVDDVDCDEDITFRAKRHPYIDGSSQFSDSGMLQHEADILSKAPNDVSRGTF